jgi:DNA primase
MVELSMSDIENVKSHINIVDLVGEYVELKKAGSNFKGICPFHNEKSPSFMVNPSLQIYKCFGCGRGGDVLSFVQEIERMDFGDALKLVAEKAGVVLEDTYSKKNKEDDKKKERAFESHQLAGKLYHYLLTSHKVGKEARDYAQKRGLTSDELQTYYVGYAPSSKSTLKNYLISKGFSEKELVEYGLLVDRDGTTIDKFRNRLMQPVKDTRGRTVGFSGRYLGTYENAPKYLNSPETVIFKKNQLLYGLNEVQEGVRKNRKIILLEGNLDVIAAYKAGTDFAVAPLGTAFTASQAKLLKRYADLILLAFDKDTAGQNALIRSLDILEKVGVRHKVVDYHGAKDPDELIQQDPKAWVKAVENPVNTVEYISEFLLQDIDLGDPDDKVTYKDKIIPIIKMLHDPVERDHHSKEAALRLEISVDEFKSLLEKNDKKFIPKSDDEQDAPVKNSVEIKQEEFLLALILQNEFKDEEFEIDIFSVSPLHEIAKYYFNNNLESITDSSKETRSMYEKILLIDVSTVEDPQHEVQSLYKRLYGNYIDKELMRLQSKLNGNDRDAMTRVNELIKLKRSLR